MKKFIKNTYHPSITFFFFFVCSINMSNLLQNEIDQIKKEIDLLQDRLKKNEKSQNRSISKWVIAHQKNTSKKLTKDGSFSSQKNTKCSEEYISK